MGNLCSDADLQEACAIEAHPIHLSPSSTFQSWEPAPRTIRDIMKMPEGHMKSEWLRSVKKELKTLVDNKTFIHDTSNKGERVMPVMEVFKVKIKSDGSLDKLKTHLVVHGDKWSPTASFWALKMFLAHTTRVRARVKQLDFVGAFLQAQTRSRIFVPIPPIFGILFPEYKEYCGKPVRLGKSMYGMTLSSKYWFLDLQEFLLELCFSPSKTILCLFIKKDSDGHHIFILDYVNDMLYYGIDGSKVKQFEDLL